ncbi:serine palmitoyltransferase 2 (SPTLC2) [Vairimorpha necatrix]|uniref:serine C-palmitoyltransferase n=1 Tax=Vairimorpha necatrix TaxID=6039 RepID=A0AAX4J9C2_9MICR
MYTASSTKFSLLTTYLSFLIIFCIGYIKDIARKILKINKNKSPSILSDLQSFYGRTCARRISDCLNFPVKGRPGRIIHVLNRIQDTPYSLKITKEVKQLINFGSYNYLGFGDTPDKLIKKLHKTIDKYPINIAACYRDIGRHKLIIKLEKEMASFLHKEDCVVFPMGYGTNTSNIPCLLSEGTLVYSDILNHASIITGLKMGKAVIKTFKHNDMEDLEKRLIFDISQGQPTTHRSWEKIIVIVEGIYSMEGTILKLNELINLKKKYKFYIFIDEAHSIGALGQTGRGVCEYHNVDFNDIDILMGTFTKSFASMGGYIAASKSIVDHLRIFSDFSRFGEQMSPVVARQILECLKIIKYKKLGLRKLEKLRRNVQLMRNGLKKLNMFVLGDESSPVIPVIITHPAKMCELSRICREEGIGVVIVGYPGAPILYGRVRLCMSSSHRKKDIKKTLEIFKEADKLLGFSL